MTDRQFHRDSHFVHRGYLKRWARADGKLAVHRLLVSHPNVRLWSWSSTKSIAYHEHLYTRSTPDGEDDGVERWLDREFESPAEDALERATTGRQLTPAHWHALSRFVAAQDVRTPKRMRWYLDRMSAMLPEMLESTLQRSIQQFESASSGTRPPSPGAPRVAAADFPVRVVVERNSGGEGGTLGAEVLVGRAMWLWGLEHLLTSTLKVLARHRWTVVHPPKGKAFFTTDAPVLRLTFNSETDYGLDGGWGRPGAEILLPLSPDHMLYTQIERKVPTRGTRLEVKQFELICRCLAENADRFVFASAEDPTIVRYRGRIVDAARFKAEADELVHCHERQWEAELEFSEARRKTQAMFSPPAAETHDVRRSNMMQFNSMSD